MRMSRERGRQAPPEKSIRPTVGRTIREPRAERQGRFDATACRAAKESLCRARTILASFLRGYALRAFRIVGRSAQLYQSNGLEIIKLEHRRWHRGNVDTRWQCFAAIRA